MKDEVGFVYVISNASMPGVVKIGMTQTSPAQRAQELVSTGVPSKFQVDYFCVVYNPLELEKAVHCALHQHRTRGEWFAISPFEAVAAIQGAGSKLLDQFWNDELQQRLEFEDIEAQATSHPDTKFGFLGNQAKVARNFLSNDALKELIATAAQSAGRGLAEVVMDRVRNLRSKRKS